MSEVYVVTPNGSSKSMTPVLAKDEDKELQTILEQNYRLLPGDQIDPDEPCRWMLVKREMPVPDTATGADRWNIDFLFVDQNATPTFVECKRYRDTRSRREVVGQLLEYVANGQHYWTAADMQSKAEGTALRSHTTAEQSFLQLQTDIADSVDAFFKEVERRLKAGEVRIIFFLEQAPVELKRLVEFMNKHMDIVEVLLVEARQYASDGVTIVVPTLFGFTEQIRDIKKAASAQQAPKPVATDWESFGANAAQKGLDDGSIAVMRKVYDACKSLQADIAWGRGSVTGSFSPKWAKLARRVAPFSVLASGNLELHFPALQNSDVATSFAETFAAKLLAGGVPLPLDYMSKWFSVEPGLWMPKADVLITALQDSLAAQPAEAADIGEGAVSPRRVVA
jgi:hypothetical protein